MILEVKSVLRTSYSDSIAKHKPPYLRGWNKVKGYVFGVIAVVLTILSQQ